jgi:salicylate hydroxylase
MVFGDRKIALIGGGLGGMAFMNSAIHAGLKNVHLYEAAPEFIQIGAGVNITKNANRVLDAFGLGEKMLWKSSRDPSSYMKYRHYRTGEYLGQIDEFGSPKSRQIHRADLLDVLREQVPDSLVSTGKRLVNMEWSSESKSYILYFQDGSTQMSSSVAMGSNLSCKNVSISRTSPSIPGKWSIVDMSHTMISLQRPPSCCAGP